MKQNLDLERTILFSVKEDKNNFNQLYKYFVGDVYRFAYSIINLKEEAEDITSKVFIKFYENIDKYEWKNISMKYWLFQTARNFCYEKFKKPIEESFEEDFNSTTELNFVDEIINLELVNHIKEEIEKLNALEKETINLRIWEELPFKEIAEIQNSNMRTVQKRFYRSIEKIKKNFIKTASISIFFTAIKQVYTTHAYALPLSLSESRFVSGKLIKELNMETTNTKFMTPSIQFGIIAILITAATLTAGIFFANSLNKNNGKNKIGEQSLALTPTESTNTSPKITTFVDDSIYGITMDLPEGWTAEAQKGMRNATVGDILTITKNGESILKFYQIEGGTLEHTCKIKICKFENIKVLGKYVDLSLMDNTSNDGKAPINPRLPDTGVRGFIQFHFGLFDYKNKEDKLKTDKDYEELKFIIESMRYN